MFSVPALRDDRLAAVACDCMSNSGVWADDTEFFHTYVRNPFMNNGPLLSDRTPIHRYTLLLPKEIPRYLGCDLTSPNLYMQVFRAKRLPRPFSELTSRENLTTWLTRVLVHTLFPPITRPAPFKVILPHNLLAFLHLLQHLHIVGYPGHWISDLLARILNSTLQTDLAPYAGTLPIPAADRFRRVPARRVRTDPWSVELETALAFASSGGLPFPLPLAVLPLLSIIDSDDIVTWEVPLSPTQDLMRDMAVNGRKINDPCAQLFVYRADRVVLSALIGGGLRRVFERAAGTPAPGMFFVLTALEHMDYMACVRFKLGRQRIARMKDESARWCAVVVCNDTGVPGVSCHSVLCLVSHMSACSFASHADSVVDGV